MSRPAQHGARQAVQLGHHKGASLRILAMNLDTATANGRLMMNVLGSVAQFEREIMLERQREGIVKAKAEGKVRQLHATGVGAVDIAKQLGIGRNSVYRVLDGASE